MTEKKKILLYNWCPFDLDKNQGGGVSVYIRNVLDNMSQNPKYDMYFLSSGYRYNPMTSKSYIQKSENIFGDRVKTFELINSRVIGPLSAVCYSMDVFMDDDSTIDVLSNFIEEQGGFDIIHINNLGGISQKILTLKQKFPNTKFIYDLHNYNSVCINSLLFDKLKKEKCSDYKNGCRCLDCATLGKNVYRHYMRRRKAYFYERKFDFVKYLVKKFFGRADTELSKYFKELSKKTSSNEDFIRMRENNIRYINQNIDEILAVSQRVKEIAVAYGLDENKVKCSYIGTKFADNPRPPRDYNGDFTIAYIGYANAQKGFDFLINALAQLPSEISSKVNVVLAAAKMNEDVVEEKLQNFASLSLYNGYKSTELEGILKNVDLGIVPVIWEDNLPQVAIEMVSFGIPVLASSFGGASELSGSEFFKFKGANTKDFVSKLVAIVEQPELLEDYWKYSKKLTTMKSHCDSLENIYEG